MAEVPYAGEYHRDSQPVCGLDHGVVAHRASGLDHSGGTGLHDGLKAIWEGKKCVRGCYRAFEGQNRLHRSETRRIHATHLPGADADRLTAARIDDGVRLHVLGHLPGKQQVGELLWCRRPLGDGAQIVRPDRPGVGILQQQPAGDLLEDARACRRVDDDQPQVLLGGEAGKRSLSEAGRRDRLDK